MVGEFVKLWRNLIGYALIIIETGQGVHRDSKYYFLYYCVSWNIL